jgi:ATP-dependent helicase HrpA
MPALTPLHRRLPGLMPRDQRRLRRRLDGVGKVRDPRAREAVLGEIAAEVDAAEARVAARRDARPEITYPAELPITAKKDEILAAIRDHQVVIVAGETGSGKTTQLPKICLELGRGVLGTIGHTQPRRLAARTVADRIAEELGTTLGETVGYKVRFTDQVGDSTLVKLMTDGILLAEIAGDRSLTQYDTLIIDEAHERSLNIDFILGYVKQLLPRRPDLKVVITSATIDPLRFSRHFNDAPVIEVSGRTYPVEVRYRPIEDDEDPDQIQAICDAVEELSGEPPGDILAFLSGEREIRDTADALNRLKLRNTEVLPLYARLSTAEQHRVFQPHAGRRIVLATNVAETSLTVPGVKYVIDPGTARISRYSHRLKVQRLPIEPVSQASANQRKGRCGRTSDGICVRLYSEVDFLARPEFTDAEILRTNLASVILQMTALGLGDIAAFPFIDPPERRNIADGVQLLQELGAFDPDKRLTPVGRKLAQLPVDPRLARMVLSAGDNGCLREVLVIASALSIQDPRERPSDKQQQADQVHARFADPESDFLAYLNLWRHLREQQKALSSNQFRRMCRTEFLNYLRVREWQDIHTQLRQVARTLGLSLNSTPAQAQPVHVSLLAGLLSHIGLKDPDTREYAGARGAKFAIFPGSALFKKPPRWVMAAELVETSRLWARTVARIEPEWAESLAGHLVKRSYSEPHWSAKQGAVLASEKVTLYGLPIVASRKVNYGRIDPRLSRELFIRHALVEGDWDTHHQFFHDNQALLQEIEDLEHRARRRDIVVDDETLFAFYDERVGPEVVSGRHFDSWWKKVRRQQPDLLTFDRSMLINEGRGGLSAADYPDAWVVDGLRLPLTYQFEPGTAADGVTVHIPLSLLNQVPTGGFEWQVPGLREELVTALIRSLPKQLRVNFVPVPDYARAVLDEATPAEGPLLDTVERQLRRLTAVPVPHNAWQLDRVPDHLKMTFRVVDEQDRTVDQDKDLAALKQRLRGAARAAVSAAAATAGIERSGLRTGDFGVLPRALEQERAGFTVKTYPALADEGDSAAVRLFDTEAEQRVGMWQGTRRLLLLGLPAPIRLIQGRLSNQAKLALTHNPHGSVGALLDDCLGCAVDKLMTDAGGPAWDADGFVKLRDQVRAAVADTMLDVVSKVERILAAGHEVELRLARTSNPLLVPALADIRAQLSKLIHPGFVTATGWWRLPDLPRYLQAIERRLDRLPQNPQRDREQMARVQQVQQEYREFLAELPPARAASPEAHQIRWMIEELRVTTFAQALGTPYPVSDKRIYRAMDDLADPVSLA